MIDYKFTKKQLEELDKLAGFYYKIKRIYTFIGYKRDELRNRIKSKCEDSNLVETENYIIQLRSGGSKYFSVKNRYDHSITATMEVFKELAEMEKLNKNDDK